MAIAKGTAAFTKDELVGVERYLRKTFGNQTIKLSPLPRKDSAEMLVGGESVAIVSKDAEDPEDITYHVTMAILAMDVE